MPSAQDQVAYVVRAACPSERVREAYVHWLVGSETTQGHAAEVIAAGARKATVIRHDHGPSGPHDGRWIAEVRYTFEGQSALDQYLRDHAPRLRAQGLALFGPGGSVAEVEFSRFVGVEVWSGGAVED